MYIPEKIKALSNSQISKMLSGLPVRVQKGAEHIINMSMEQSKKLNKAAMKGKGFTITLDPYQVIEHRNLAGQGLFGDALKSASSMAKSAAKKAGKQLAQKGLKMASSYAQQQIDERLGGEGLFGDALKSASSMAKSAAKKAGKQLAQKGLKMASSYAQEQIDKRLSGEGFFGDLGKLAKSTAKSVGKQVARKSLNLAHKTVSEALPTVVGKLGSVVGHPEIGYAVEPALQMASDASFSAIKKKSGLGIKKRGRPRKPRSVGRPRKPKARGRPRKGGALRPAGY